jgi:hypothetical protein
MWWDDYMVVLPLAMDAVNFASLWVLYSYQSEDWFQLLSELLLTFWSTGKEGTTLLPPTGISSFWVADFLFLSVVW